MKDTEQALAFSQRPEFYSDVSRAEWQDWRWQQRNAVKDIKSLERVFPRIQHSLVDAADGWQKRGFRYALTPYMMSLVKIDQIGNPILSDPVWRQFFPFTTIGTGKLNGRADEYSASRDNWESPDEMITPICQWKYDNRAIIYTADYCLAYCIFCLRSLQSTDPHEKHGGRPHWQATMEAIRNRPEINEVIISGGDPMVYDNAVLDEMLHDIRDIPSVEMIRIHTRAWTHNPYRIDEGFCELLRRHEVTEMAVHVNHPDEISDDLHEAIGRVRESGARTILLSQSALLKGVNDDADVLRKHFLTLYASGVKPYYFLHCMPNVPAAHEQRTSVRRGAELMATLKRHISNPAMPEYCIVHETGKKTVPEPLEGTSEFVYTRWDDGHPIIRFKNWKGVWCEYLDGID
ncbi:radical SAM protein [Patescibacteria group bacterium]|nr:radical SAM protein [Patescibacteria group bacterium]MDE2011274.1 radical SAM protein [Patescibacteria group bacterium]MDE2233760.1 radical SAM protein [Patescibacteria group bacterium]